MPNENNAFKKPSLEDYMDRPKGMSKKRWEKIKKRFEQGKTPGGLGFQWNPFGDGGQRDQLMIDWANMQEDALGIMDKNETNFELFNELFAGLGQFEGLEGFADLEAGYDLDMADVAGAIPPEMFGELLGINKRFEATDADLKNFTVDPSIIPIYEEGGEVVLAPIQTEEGEIAIFEEGTISDVKSKSTHKEMDEDEITDIMPESGWILSEKVMVKKKDADISFGYSEPLYEEVNNDTTVEEINFKDLFKEDEDELSVAELARRVKKKFPVNDQEIGNVLTNLANIENKMSRLPYLEVLRILTEQHLEEEEEPVMDIPHFDGGGAVGKFLMENSDGLNPAAFLSTLYGIVTDIQQKNQLRRDRAKADKMIDRLSDAQKENLQMGLLSSLSSIFGQDPSSEPVDSSAAMATYKQSFDRTPQYMKDSTYDRINSTFSEGAREVMRNSPNYSQAMENLGGLYAQKMETEAGIGRDLSERDLQMRNNFLSGLAEMKYRDAIEQARARNEERTNRNQQISSTGDMITNFTTQDSVNQKDETMMKLGVMGNFNEAMAASNVAQTQNVVNLLASMGLGTGSTVPQTPGTREGTGLFDISNSTVFRDTQVPGITGAAPVLESTVPDFQNLNIPSVLDIYGTPQARPSNSSGSLLKSPYEQVLDLKSILKI